MKRIAAIILLAGFGTGCTTTQPLKSTTAAENATSAQAAMGAAAKSGVVQTSARVDEQGVQQAAGFAKVTGGCSSCGTGGTIAGGTVTGGTIGCADGGCGHGGFKVRKWGGLGLNRGCPDGSCGHGGFSGFGHGCGPGGCGVGGFGHGCGPGGCGHGGYGGFGGHGIMPAMPMGPAGAVAAIGAIGPGMGIPVASNMRTAIRFLGNGKITWYAGGTYAEPGLTMPADYNFAQGNIYRLKISNIPNRPGKVYYPTLEVAPATIKSLTFLDHGNVPVSFTDEDLQRVDSGNLVVKVIYLPDSLYQDVTVSSGIEEIISTQLEPGVDPIVEANRRGTILAIIRLGNINLENPNSPAKEAPPSQMLPNMTPAAPPSMAPAAPLNMSPSASPSMSPSAPLAPPMANPMSKGPVELTPAPMPAISLPGTRLK